MCFCVFATQKKASRFEESEAFEIHYFAIMISLRRYNQHKRGLKVAKDLRLSERLLCAARVQGLAEGQDWVELDKVSKEKKIPPIG